MPSHIQSQLIVGTPSAQSQLCDACLRHWPIDHGISAVLPAIVASMIDRVVHHADVLTLKGASHRLRNRGIDTLPSIGAGIDQPAN